MSRRSSTIFSFISLVVMAFFGFRPAGETASAQSSPTAWTPELSMKVKAVGNVRVSPDGKRVLFTVNEPVMTADKSEYLSHIWMVNADGTDAYQITFGEKPSSNPDWSPDGRWIAFTSSRSGKNNLYLMRAGGGEAEVITDVKSSVGGYAWAPDSQSIALTVTDSLSADEEKGNKGKEDARWVDENVKLNHLYVVPIVKNAEGKREMRQLTKGDFTVGSGLGGGGGYDWSPDGKSIVFTQTKTPKADDWTSSNVSVVDVATGAIKPLATTPAADFLTLVEVT
jgi:Tol biopolymer transport system component